MNKIKKGLLGLGTAVAMTLGTYNANAQDDNKTIMTRDELVNREIELRKQRNQLPEFLANQGVSPSIANNRDSLEKVVEAYLIDFAKCNTEYLTDEVDNALKGMTKAYDKNGEIILETRTDHSIYMSAKSAEDLIRNSTCNVPVVVVDLTMGSDAESKKIIDALIAENKELREQGKEWLSGIAVDLGANFRHYDGQSHLYQQNGANFGVLVPIKNGFGVRLGGHIANQHTEQNLTTTVLESTRTASGRTHELTQFEDEYISEQPLVDISASYKIGDGKYPVYVQAGLIFANKSEISQSNTRHLVYGVDGEFVGEGNLPRTIGPLVDNHSFGPNGVRLAAGARFATDGLYLLGGVNLYQNIPHQGFIGLQFVPGEKFGKKRLGDSL